MREMWSTRWSGCATTTAISRLRLRRQCRRLVRSRGCLIPSSTSPAIAALPREKRNEQGLSQRMRGRRNPFRQRERNCPPSSRLARPRRRADFCNHGAAHARRRRAAGYHLLSGGAYIAAERDDPDVLVDERLPFAALAEADFQPA